MILALLDANVIFPAPIRDLLLSLAEDGHFKPFWTEEIHQEWKRNLLQKRPELDSKGLERTITLMNEAFPDASIEGYERRIEALSLKDPNDRHVLAAALEANTDYLVTVNLKDFKTSALKNEKPQVIHPDDFICLFISENPASVLDCFSRLVSRLKKPPQSKEDVLRTLTKIGLLNTAAKIRGLLA
ncbi:PIN domain-containing protein [Cecembia lonarensis]|uniref:Uncharacterized protein n=1 Tax=Cecembia lonarensis (strain CCUG 58316 / KCTC 22772 / LW9) TaxID=1225176 RepID=K1KUL3_CECL9|nr:PIN domain-containing protein [Cecembia lonarensis]EKB47845.1 hypothetical protein B879_03554 [Cecembia lonarensis LW9]